MKGGEVVGQAKKSIYVPPAPGSASVQGSLDNATLMRVVTSHLGQIRACNELSKQREPDRHGKLTMRMTIAPDGTVKKVEVVESGDLRSSQFASCITTQIKTWRFPMHDGADLVVLFPFKF